MTWLVLCPVLDDAGRWAFDQLRRAGLEPVELVTDADLVGADWDHRLGQEDPATELRLADGRTIASDAVRGTLNRLMQTPAELTGMLAPVDREYGHAEFSALLLSWLAALRGPILNPPTTRGLAGAWRSGAEWGALADEAGLPCAPVVADSGADVAAEDVAWVDWAPYAPLPGDAIVVGSVVFSARPLGSATRDACRRLAEVAGSPLLGLAFEWMARAGLPHLCGATTLPDLRAGGDPLVRALAAELRGANGP